MTSLPNDIKYILPAEWEPQDCVQLTWAHEDTDWRPYMEDITAVLIRLAATIAKYERVLIAARDAETVATLLSDKLSRKVMENIFIVKCDNNDTWARDHAFITLVPVHRNDPEALPRLLDFRFNGWGEKFPADKDNAVNATLYDRAVLRGEYIDCGDFVLEGGSVESDGRGTVFTTSHCLLAPHRNQPLSREKIEQQLLRRLAAKRIVWLDHGSLIGDDTDGHIDTTVRLAPNDTLLYICCDDTDDPQYDDFKALERQLLGLRTIDGNPYRLLPLPMPAAIYDGGERLPATYANFLIINGAVIMPTYAQQSKDEEAARTLQQAFPDRRIIGVDARTVIRQHGSLHCLTMQYPKGTLMPMI